MKNETEKMVIALHPRRAKIASAKPPDMVYLPGQSSSFLFFSSNAR